jgi:hypothetical protein
MFANNTFFAKSDSNLDTLMQYINGKVNKKQFGFVPTNWQETLTKLSTCFFHTAG